MIKYVFRDAPLTIKNGAKANPQKIGEALAKISASGAGSLTPSAVVDAARLPRHVLHPHFEWDDQKAAESWRLDQARILIRCIHIEDEEAPEGRAPAFISVTQKSGVSYHTLAAVRESSDLQASILVAAERDLEAWEKRYHMLQDICEIVRNARETINNRRTEPLRSESRAS